MTGAVDAGMAHAAVGLIVESNALADRQERPVAGNYIYIHKSEDNGLRSSGTEKAPERLD